MQGIEISYKKNTRFNDFTEYQPTAMEIHYVGNRNSILWADLVHLHKLEEAI